MKYKQEYRKQGTVPDGRCIIEDIAQVEKLAPMAEVMGLLKDGERSFTDLEPIRKCYENSFVEEQVWNYPFYDGRHQGGILLPVQEGVLYLPYNYICPDFYEQFELEDIHLLDGVEAQRLQNILDERYTSLIKVLKKVANCETAGEQANQAGALDPVLQSILEQQACYITMQMCPVTERLPINDISRDLIQAMSAVYDTVYRNLLELQIY